MLVFEVLKSLRKSHCESYVVGKGFPRGLGVTVIFYSVHNKTKTQPRVRQERHCINAKLFRLYLGYDATEIIWASSLSVKVRPFETKWKFCLRDPGRNELKLGSCGIWLRSSLQKSATDLNTSEMELAKHHDRHRCKTMFTQKASAFQTQTLRRWDIYLYHFCIRDDSTQVLKRHHNFLKVKKELAPRQEGPNLMLH